MDAFALRNRLVDDYSAYIRSFITIRDPRIGQVVDDELRNGLLWPDPLLQLNPSFEPGPWIDELVASGRLHPECRSIFRIKQDDKPDKPLRLHKHQAEAVEAAASGDSYVLTTGTGSGKSLAYIIPIVDFVLRHGSGQGIRAIVVYPMNALANSQANELEKFLCREKLLEEHRRVRGAARQTGVRYSVQPQLPVDVLGIYLLLPAAL
jgi:ATP-dependent helicase YprA (DUF1998 family)